MAWTHFASDISIQKTHKYLSRANITVLQVGFDMLVKILLEADAILMYRGEVQLQMVNVMNESLAVLA